jgi:ubiquinone/menaquinone biosynthesis C-methylase UbiE
MKLLMSQHQELSITDLFESYFQKNYPEIDLDLYHEIPLYLNIKLLKDKFGKNFLAKCYKALGYAFDTKYGNWDNVNDLRTLRPSLWYEPIKDYFKDIQPNDELIDIGGNDGHELLHILRGNVNKPRITLLDISKTALSRFQLGQYSNNFELINKPFIKARIQKNFFDYCISLRTLHSTGIDTKENVAKCCMITKPGGLIVISVSNGYIDKLTNEPVKGMFDYSSGIVDIDKPFAVTQEIVDTITKLKIKNIEVVEGFSEIFIIAFKYGR